jgi:hypothetical protein
MKLLLDGMVEVSLNVSDGLSVRLKVDLSVGVGVDVYMELSQLRITGILSIL